MTVAHCFQRLNQMLRRRKVHTARDRGHRTKEASQLCSSQRCTKLGTFLKTLQILVCGSGLAVPTEVKGSIPSPYSLRSGKHRPLLAARLL